MVSSFISPLTGVNTSNMLVKLNFITGAVQEFVWSVSYPVLILNSWLFQPFQLKFCEMAASRETSRANSLGSPFGWPLHSGSKWLKPAKKYLPSVISRIFQIKFQQIHLISVSGHCKCFIFKMCQNVAAIRINSQFHEFLKFNFERVFVIWKYCALPEGWHWLPGRVNFALQAPDCNRKFSLFRQQASLSSAWKRPVEWNVCVSAGASAGVSLKFRACV